jgi:dTDP-4-dehydrorhamnose 3,5-epimerase-like enzyme
MTKEYKEPYLINFGKLGKPDIGYISVGEISRNIPFPVQRVFWTYHTPESIVRGRHAHYKTEQILICVTGRIIVNIENAEGQIWIHNLESSEFGLYVPPNCWHTMQYSHTSVQLVLASTEYQESDYIREYSLFKKYWSK